MEDQPFIKSDKGIRIWIPIGIAGFLILVAVIVVLYLVITGNCSYCKKKRYKKKVERYKKAAAEAVPASLKESQSIQSKSLEKKKKVAKHQNGIVANGVVQNRVIGNGVIQNGLISNGVIQNGVISHGVIQNGVMANNVSNGIITSDITGNRVIGNAPLPLSYVQNGDVWQTSLPVLTSQPPPPYFIYSAPNYMTTLPNDNNAKYLIMPPNGNVQQKYASKTLPRGKPAKLTTENLMKYQQQNGMVIEKTIPLVRPLQLSNKNISSARMNGHATLPNMKTHKRANIQPRLMNGHIVSDNDIAKVNNQGHVTGFVPEYLTNISDHPTQVTPILHDLPSTNGSLYPIKYVDDKGQVYIFDKNQFADNNHNTNNHIATAVSTQRKATARVNGQVKAVITEHDIVTRTSDTIATTSVHTKSSTTENKMTYLSTATAVSAVVPANRPIMSTHVSKPNNEAFTATAISQPRKNTPLPRKKDVNGNAFNFQNIDGGGDREVKEVSVFMRWSPQLDKRQMPNEGSLQYVAKVHAGGNGVANDTIVPNQNSTNPTILVTAESGDVTVPRNNAR